MTGRPTDWRLDGPRRGVPGPDKPPFELRDLTPAQYRLWRAEMARLAEKARLRDPAAVAADLEAVADLALEATDPSLWELVQLARRPLDDPLDELGPPPERDEQFEEEIAAMLARDFATLRAMQGPIPGYHRYAFPRPGLTAAATLELGSRAARARRRKQTQRPVQASQRPRGLTTTVGRPRKRTTASRPQPAPLTAAADGGIAVPARLLERIRTHAAEVDRERPGFESVGRLLVNEAGRAIRYLRLRNASPAPGGMALGTSWLEEPGLRSIVVHSHPTGPADPSPADLTAAGRWAWANPLGIYALEAGRLAVYDVKHGRPVPMPLRIGR